MIYLYVGVAWVVGAFVLGFVLAQMTYSAMDLRRVRRGRLIHQESSAVGGAMFTFAGTRRAGESARATRRPSGAIVSETPGRKPVSTDVQGDGHSGGAASAYPGGSNSGSPFDHVPRGPRAALRDIERRQ